MLEHNKSDSDTCPTYEGTSASLQSHHRGNTVKPAYLDGQGVSYDAIHRVFCEGVKVFVRSSHELRLQPVAAPAIVFEHEEIQLHGQICNKWAEINAGPADAKREVTAIIQLKPEADGRPEDEDSRVLGKTDCP